MTINPDVKDIFAFRLRGLRAAKTTIRIRTSRPRSRCERAPRGRIVMVAAVADNGVIGADDALPWRLKSDLKRLRR